MARHEHRPLQPSVRARRSAAPGGETLVSIHEEARRERLLDMETRVRRYRTACFAILALAIALGGSSEVGWWWVAAAGGRPCRLRRRRPLHADQQPSGDLGRRRLGGAAGAARAPPCCSPARRASPVLVWFALPAVTLGFRFEPRGMVDRHRLHPADVLVACAVVPDPAAALEHRQTLIAAAALILSTVILSGALVESDRAHRRRSTLDPLTGLFNRNALEQRLAELNGQPCSPEEGLSHALLLCDLDHFKRVNDQLGHAAGDAVLQDVAYTMRAALQAGDTIYRVGGEEILVILPGAGREDAIEIAERLRHEVHERRPVGVQVTVSIGVAVSEPDVVDTDDLIARADAALYAAKASGRDTVFVDDALTALSG